MLSSRVIQVALVLLDGGLCFSSSAVKARTGWLLTGVLYPADGTWHGEFTDHQAHLMGQEPHQGGGEADCMGSHMGHKAAMGVPDFLPAMQKALYARLSHKHPRDGDAGSSQGQRAMSKDEGKETLVRVLNILC